MEGIFERRSNGKNRVLTEEGYPIFIAERNSLRAMNGDKVRIQLYAKRKNRQPEGEVIEILEKAPQVYVGTLDVQPKFAFLVTDNKILANDIFIPKEKLKGGKDGQKAVCPHHRMARTGQKPTRRGNRRLRDSRRKQLLKYTPSWPEFGLPYNYPENVIKAARTYPRNHPGGGDQKTRRFPRSHHLHHRPQRRQGFRRCPLHPPREKRPVGSRGTHCRRNLLCYPRLAHRPRSRAPGYLRLSGGPGGPHVTRTAVQPNLLAPPRRRETLFLGYLRIGRKGRD